MDRFLGWNDDSFFFESGKNGGFQWVEVSGPTYRFSPAGGGRRISDVTAEGKWVGVGGWCNEVHEWWAEESGWSGRGSPSGPLTSIR